MIEFNVDFVRGVLASHADRVETIRMAGGIPLRQAVEDNVKPEGCWFDHETDYYVPLKLTPQMLDGSYTPKQPATES